MTVSLFLLVHPALLIFTDLTREYHGFGIWIVVGVLTAIAALLLLGADKEDGVQNCVHCPMNIPITRAIYEDNRETVVHGLFGWLRR